MLVELAWRCESLGQCMGGQFSSWGLGIAGVNGALSESSMGEMAQTSESVQIGERVHIGEGLRIGERVQICEGVQVVGGDW